MALHPSPSITWIDDGFPDLVGVRGRTFDLVWMSAVWMHFDAHERATMFPTVAALVAIGGGLMMTLRHGPIPNGRRMFDVTGRETIDLAVNAKLRCTRSVDGESARQPGVTWTRLWFVR